MSDSEQLIDYANPCMMAEQELKSVHMAMLNNGYDAALDHAVKAVAEIRLMMHSINHMKEKDHGLRQQTSPV